MILAIFQNERVYEGNLWVLNALYPMPSLSPVTEPVPAIIGYPNQITPLLFREDSFDPTTRIRRGRFYIAHSPSRQEWRSGQVNHLRMRSQSAASRCTIKWMPINHCRPIVWPGNRSSFSAM